ncbi:hypothetical protein DF035_35135 [Burkholderia contaminans]|nr:hypothetical protein DF035_35135 [Burkholderia contaminans]
MFARRRNNGGTSVILESAQDIPVQSPKAIWKDWLYGGKVHLLAGPPSTGKTTIAMDFAATVSTGRSWPDGTCSPRGRVVIWSSEDGIGDTVVPRLISAGADLRNIEVVSMTEENWLRRPFDPVSDLPLLEDTILDRGDVALVIIDSIADLMPSSPGNNSKVRKSLLPLVGLAERTGCAVLGLTHVVKASRKKHPLERIIGGVGLGAVVRVAMLVARDDSGGFGAVREWSVLVKAKANICREDGGVLYRPSGAQISDPNGVVESSRIQWGSTVRGSAMDILNMAEGTARGAATGKVHQAGDFLLTTLQAGPMAASEVEARAAEAGISRATLRRAREQFGIESFKQRGLGSASPYLWGAPASAVGDNMPHAGNVPARAVWGCAGVSVESPAARPLQGSVDGLPNGLRPAGYDGKAHAAHLEMSPVSPFLARQDEQADRREQDEQPGQGEQSGQGERGEQAGRVEPTKFTGSVALWDALLSNCVTAYMDLRKKRPYDNEDDEYTVRQEAIDDALQSIEGINSALKGQLRERLLNEDLFSLADRGSLA